MTTVVAILISWKPTTLECLPSPSHTSPQVRTPEALQPHQAMLPGTMAHVQPGLTGLKDSLTLVIMDCRRMKTFLDSETSAGAPVGMNDCPKFLGVRLPRVTSGSGSSALLTYESGVGKEILFWFGVPKAQGLGHLEPRDLGVKLKSKGCDCGLQPQTWSLSLSSSGRRQQQH